LTLKKLVPKYIQNTERVFTEMTITQGSLHINEEKIGCVLETAKRYLEDAKYYRERNKLETSLASVAYCEGLLDGLRLLGVVEFSWQIKK